MRWGQQSGDRVPWQHVSRGSAGAQNAGLRHEEVPSEGAAVQFACSGQSEIDVAVKKSYEYLDIVKTWMDL